MYLTNQELEVVVRTTPLITIDLCIFKENSILLGKRLNQPAKDFFFVPGGRIRKSEILSQAMDRIIYQETGRKVLKANEIKFIGVFEHFYSENFLDSGNFDTHIVVLSYFIPIRSLTNINKNFFDKQHSELIWFDIDSTEPLKIHEYTKAYFQKIKDLNNF